MAPEGNPRTRGARRSHCCTWEERAAPAARTSRRAAGDRATSGFRPWLPAHRAGDVARRIGGPDGAFSLADLEVADAAPDRSKQPDTRAAGLVHVNHLAVVERVGAEVQGEP